MNVQGGGTTKAQTAPYIVRNELVPPRVALHREVRAAPIVRCVQMDITDWTWRIEYTTVIAGDIHYCFRL
jgi:hypothetical protein